MPISQELIDRVTSHAIVEFDTHFDVEGFVNIGVSYKTVDFDDDGSEKVEVYGGAQLFAFDGSDERELLMLADSYSGDVLYTVECAATYNPIESRLFVVMDVMGIDKEIRCHAIRADMISKIEKLLCYMSGPVYFTFLPETVMDVKDEEYSNTIEHLVANGYQMNVGPERKQLCLARILEDC